MYNLDTEKKTRQKFILAAGVVVVVIIALIVAIVSVASNKPQKGSIGDGIGNTIVDDNTDATGNGEVATGEKTDENKENTEAETSAESETNAENEAGKDTSIFGTVITTRNENASQDTVTNTSESLPSTGPEDMLPLALVLGLITASTVAFVISEKKVREAGL